MKPVVILGFVHNSNSETVKASAMLSGMATWLNLALMSAFGIEYQTNGIVLTQYSGRASRP